MEENTFNHPLFPLHSSTTVLTGPILIMTHFEYVDLSPQDPRTICKQLLAVPLDWPLSTDKDCSGACMDNTEKQISLWKTVKMSLLITRVAFFQFQDRGGEILKGRLILNFV